MTEFFPNKNGIMEKKNIFFISMWIFRSEVTQLFYFFDFIILSKNAFNIYSAFRFRREKKRLSFAFYEAFLQLKKRYVSRQIIFIFNHSIGYINFTDFNLKKNYHRVYLKHIIHRKRGLLCREFSGSEIV